MDLKTFLLARVAEDEAVAKAAFGEPFLSSVDDGVWEANTSSRSPNVTGTSYFSIEGGDPDCMTEGQAAHIARHDPARVLAECAAKRAIVEQHAPYGVRGNACATCADWPGMLYDRPDNVAWPCPTLRALVAVYADHPDYQPEWAQEASQA